MVERDLRLLELTGGRLHFAHVSTAAAHRRDPSRPRRAACGSPATRPRTTSALNELEVEGYRTFAKVSPPLRAEADRQAVVAGLKDGTIDVIASDHCPQDQDSKRLPFAQAACGVIGVQTMLPVSLRLVHEGELGLLALLRTMTEAPARILGLDAGRLGAGCSGRSRAVRPGGTVEDHRGQPQEPVQEHRLRGPPGRGAGGPHAGRRPHHLPTGTAEPLRSRGCRAC